MISSFVWNFSFLTSLFPPFFLEYLQKVTKSRVNIDFIISPIVFKYVSLVWLSLKILARSLHYIVYIWFKVQLKIIVGLLSTQKRVNCSNNGQNVKFSSNHLQVIMIKFKRSDKIFEGEMTPFLTKNSPTVTEKLIGWSCFVKLLDM